MRRGSSARSSCRGKQRGGAKEAVQARRVQWLQRRAQQRYEVRKQAEVCRGERVRDAPALCATDAGAQRVRQRMFECRRAPMSPAAPVILSATSGAYGESPAGRYEVCLVCPVLLSRFTMNGLDRFAYTLRRLFTARERGCYVARDAMPPARSTIRWRSSLRADTRSVCCARYR